MGSTPNTKQSSSTAFLVVMYAAAFVAAFNENIINVALNDIMGAFAVSATTAQWLVSGYMIVTSIFTATMAWLSGRFSTRKLLFAACACLIAGEALCLVAPSFAILLPSRILQAAGSGILFPLMMNVVLTCAPREKLGLFLSLGGACITLGPAFGPVVSGLMCTLFGWRAIFVVPLIGGIVVAAAGALFVRNIGQRSDAALDSLSVVLLAAGITAFVFSVGEFSANVMAGVVALVAAVILIAIFARRQLAIENPVLNVRPMANGSFWPACVLVIVAMMTTFSMSVLLPLYFEGAFGMSALTAGLLILPAIAGNAVTSVVGGRIMDKRGSWPLLPVGFALIAAGQLAISLTAGSLELGVVVALTVVVYAGVGLVLSPSQTAGLAALPPEQYAHGTALINTWNMIAASFGPSLFIGILSAGAAEAGAAGSAAALAQALGFAGAVRVAALIAVAGLVVALAYALRERKAR
ncbi:MFS transporter [Paratractidigestivibacter sp.]|uniref:MFS transporter n=1 Tax=Paratractidigestivibacter sp. TaxID=2847316 RepID=UPI002ACB0CB8|nr:MFS transporter [Paratractidigestivibacter sp.]